jgi:hypothetical protein
MDGFSRYLLRCEPLRRRPLSGPVQEVLESTFCEYGLPQTIRADNGPPFSTLAPGGLSRLAVWWIRLGIPPERTVPATPASQYHPSLRPYPRQLPHPEYPAHFRIERTYPNGGISFRATHWYLSNCLAGELVGLEELSFPQLPRLTPPRGRSSALGAGSASWMDQFFRSCDRCRLLSGRA